MFECPGGSILKWFNAVSWGLSAPLSSCWSDSLQIDLFWLSLSMEAIIGKVEPGRVVLFYLNVPKPGNIRRQIGKFKETQHEGC